MKKVNIIWSEGRIRIVSWKQKKQNNKCGKIERQKTYKKTKEYKLNRWQSTLYEMWKKRKREYIKNRKEVTKKCKEKNQ